MLSSIKATSGTQIDNKIIYQHGQFKEFMGFYDMDNEPLFTGDEVNICFTSYNGEHVTDGIYNVIKGPFGDIQFHFKELLWTDHGWNQYCISNTLCVEYKRLHIVWPAYIDRRFLCIQDQSDEYGYKDVEERNRYPFNEEKELAFHSRYIRKI